MYSSELKGYLTGLLIGDGSIGRGVTKRSFEIKSIHKDFIDQIYNDLRACTNFSMRITFVPAHFSSGCHHKDSWTLTVQAHPYFNKKYHHFYDDRRKRHLSKEAASWLTPRGIANWYMSDGYICHVGKAKGVVKNRRIDFCTDRYDMVSIQRLQKTLLQFGIETSVIKRDKFFRIRVKSNSYEAFILLIAPFVVPSMRYKLYLGYDQRPKWMSDECWQIQKGLNSAITQTGQAVG